MPKSSKPKPIVNSFSRPSSGYWQNRKVVVTGGAGFLGSFVVDALTQRGCTQIVIPRHADYDLRDREAIQKLLLSAKPDLIIHLAAVCGGIGANEANGAQFFYDNAVMGIQLMEYARQSGVAKYIQVGTVCAYPGNTPVPFKEKDLWEGYPEPTNAPYGIAKKMLLVQAQVYRKYHGFDAIYLLPANLYGPRDHFDLENSHVIPALIRKIDTAVKENRPSIEVWGTGKASREFLFAGDAAEGILLAAERYSGDQPVNLGTGSSVTIRELVTLLCRLMNYRGKVVWNKNRPDGQMRRRLDTSRARQLFGFRAATALAEGLRQTIAWYQANA